MDEGAARAARGAGLPSRLPSWRRLRAARALRRRSGAAEYRRLLEARLEGLVPIAEPLVFISQAQRSGGTLLVRLLDGHPQCYVAPFQLRGFDGALKRPLNDAAQAWDALYDSKLAERFYAGHHQRKAGVLRDSQIFPFLLPPGLQRAIYDAYVARVAEPRTRDFANAYFTSYFNAWLDFRNPRPDGKRWVVGFEPGVALGLRRLTSIGTVYPDGRGVSIIRDPWSWYASARRWERRWQDREHALDHWCRTAQGTVKWKRKVGASVRVVSFDDLLLRTEDTVRSLASWLGLDFTPSLLEPSFNGLPIAANTSFGDVETNVSTRPLGRGRAELDRDDAAYVDRRARELYERLLELAREPAGVSA